MAHFGVSGSIVRSAYLAAAGPSGDWCGFSLPGQKRHHGGRVAAAPLPVKAAPPSPLEDDDTEAATPPSP